ncbi:glycosyltransferase, partial [Helicobacter sp. MIT 21-1697]|uniref:glycosyltransferase n=1 Tax=Helicobacter sp. MIT 21-1697 TaxID=2993733 RepID=UPI00224B8FA9
IMKKILLTIFDISTFGGAERVVVNLANALNEKGHKVEILSFYQTNETLPYHIDKSIKVHFLHKNISEIAFKEYMRSDILRNFFYRIFYKHYLNIQVHSILKNFDVTIANDNCYTPFLKRKNVRYIRIIHEIFKKYRSRNRYFHTLVILTKQDMLAYQKYYKHIALIPNFLPFIPNKNTDLSQKVVLSAGRFCEEKGFLRLIDIWALAQKRMQSSMPPPHYILGSLSLWVKAR